MHILFFCNEYPTLTAAPGGIGVFVQDLARALVGLGYRISVIGFCRRSGYEEDAGVQIYKLRTGSVPLIRRGGDRFRLARVVRSFCLARGVDIVDCPDHGGWFPFGTAKPMVVRLHGTEVFFAEANQTRPSLFLSECERRTLQNASRVIAVSRHVLSETRRLFRLSLARSSIIPNMVDTRLFRPSPLKDVDKAILYFGTLTRKKGVFALAAAAAVFLGEFSEHCLLLVGKDTMTQTGERASARIRRLLPDHVRHRVFFLPPQKHDALVPLIQKASAVVLPSIMESFGIAAVEALSCGRPVVGSTFGPGPEVIEHGVSGLLCDPTKPGDIAEKVSAILRNPRLAEALGRAARLRAEERFSIERVLPMNLRVYEAISQRRTHMLGAIHEASANKMARWNYETIRCEGRPGGVCSCGQQDLPQT